MKKAYLSIGFQNRQQQGAVIETIRQVLTRFGITLFVFADNYHFLPEQEKQMMDQAFRYINESDLLIAEVSEKAIGVGIEIGYAVAKQKPVIYLRNTHAEHSTTAAGSAGNTVIYRDTVNLEAALQQLISGILI